MMIEKRAERIKCPICKREFLRRIKGMKQRKYSIPLRPYYAKTCSKKCSREYLKRWRTFKLQLNPKEENNGTN